MTTNRDGLHPRDLVPHLVNCGYSEKQLVYDIEVVNGQHVKVPITAFAHHPYDSRSACIAVLDNETKFESYRSLGTPLIFNCRQDQVEFLTQTVRGPQPEDRIPSAKLSEFFQQHKNNFSPDSVYRAKTWARFDISYQLSLIDFSLMPILEEEAGRSLAELIERVVLQAKSILGWSAITQDKGQWLLKSNFWLLAAKILKDKRVPAFTDLDLEDLDRVYNIVANHYGSANPVQIHTKEERYALRESAREIARYGHFGLVSTESLAYLYERALISDETRTELGTHSTPGFLVEYVLGKLLPWIEEMPYDQRQVLEPACGHAAFLVAAMRLLGDLSPVNKYSLEKRHQYLQERLHGYDIDSFALEIARLSLTLADVPNRDGWDLCTEDMFKEGVLSHSVSKADIVLANPPFEAFKTDKDKLIIDPLNNRKHVNKAAELLWRVVTNMKPGAIFGIVLPRGILHDKNSATLREYIAKEFEVKEILILPDKMFSLSDAESTVILGRRLSTNSRTNRNIIYKRVRDTDAKEFKRNYNIKYETQVEPSRFLQTDHFNFFVPDLEEIWNLFNRQPKFEDIANIGQGFQFCSKNNLPKGAITESGIYLEGLVEGFARFRETLQTHHLPDISWFNLDPPVICRPRHGTVIGTPQVLLNYARVSRGPWRLKAFLDQQGHPVTSRFLVIRPKEPCWPLEALWGICNSPLANAYSYSFSTERNVLAGLMRRMPIPKVNISDLVPLVNAVHNYFQAVKQFESSLLSNLHTDKLKFLHWSIDAEVLRLYNLPLHLEKQLLDLFTGEERRGVPFKQTEYFPNGFDEPLRLSDFLTIKYDWEQVNHRRVELIDKEVDDTITVEEQVELDNLQRLADCRIQLLAPLPIKELEAIQEKLKRQGMWKGN